MPKRNTKKNKLSEIKKAEDKIKDIYLKAKNKGEEKRNG
jgi:hypothetical protein